MAMMANDASSAFCIMHFEISVVVAVLVVVVVALAAVMRVVVVALVVDVVSLRTIPC